MPKKEKAAFQISVEDAKLWFRIWAL